MGARQAKIRELLDQVRGPTPSGRVIKVVDSIDSIAGFSQDDDDTTIEVVFDGRTMDVIEELENEREDQDADTEGHAFDRDRATFKEERMTTSVFFGNNVP